MRYEMWGTNNGIKNAREILNNQFVKYKFVVILGNQDWGEMYNTKEDLIKGWKRCLAMSYRQDLYLYYNGNLIRSVHNFSKKVTNKNIEYPCFYKKYLVESN